MINDDDDDDYRQHLRQRRDEIFALHRKLQKSKVDNDNDDNDNDIIDATTAGGGIIVVTPSVLETLIVPAMKDLLQNEDLKRKQKDNTRRSNNNDEIIRGVGGSSKSSLSSSSSLMDEKKDSVGDGSNDDVTDDVQYTIAILDCLLSFLTTNNNNNNKQSSSSSQRSTASSLSFRAGSRSLSKSSSCSTKESKTLFVTSGVYEMIMHLLRQILDDHCNQASAKSWQTQTTTTTTTAKSDVGIGIDSNNNNNVVGDIGIDFDYLDNGCCDVKIESCLPTNNIPIKIMKVIAIFANNSSDTIKNDFLLKDLTTIIHQSMMIYCPCSQIQGYGCWILYSLSNPLLQELIAAGSFSLLVQAMKCHPCSNKKVQEYGNKALYNLLPLLVLCSNQQQNTQNNNPNSSSKASDSPPRPQQINAMKQKSIEIDGKQLEDYESLLPSLSAIVLRGMEYHYPHQLSVQQYGLLVLMRLCQHDQEQYEVIVSEGGLTALLNIIKMTTTDTYSALSSINSGDDDDDDDDVGDDHSSNHDPRSVKDKYDSLAQMACQFLRDLSRPTNSSLDILRIIAVKGGIQTVLDLLHHYNNEHQCSTRSSVINIIDPAMACLRNLMVHEDNRTEVVTKSISIDTKQQQQDGNGTGNGGDGIIPIVLRTMNIFRYDAAIQAYGCDLLGRIASNEELGRLILIQTTINDKFSNNNGNDYENNYEKIANNTILTDVAVKSLSRLWKNRNNNNKTSSSTSETTTSTKKKNNEDVVEEEIINLSDQFSNNNGISNGSAIMTTSSSASMDSIDINSSTIGNDSIININIDNNNFNEPIATTKNSNSNSNSNNNSDDDVDSFVTIIRAMKTHRMHHGVQQRAIILLLALVVDKDNNSNNNMNSSSYLIQRLQEVYYDIQHQEKEDEEVPNNMNGNKEHQQKENNTSTNFVSFLKSTSVTSKGLDRLQKLIKIVEQYELMKQKQQGISIGGSTYTATASSRVTNLFRGWGTS